MFDRETAPSEEIDVAEEAHVAWIRSQRDASLWHQATMAALAYRSDPHDFIPPRRTGLSALQRFERENARDLSRGVRAERGRRVC